MAFTTSDFDYDLPDQLIAQHPAYPRDACRLLVLDRSSGTLTHEPQFSAVLNYFHKGDLLVVNETRVLPARLIGKKQFTGGVCECFLLKKREDLDACGMIWECLVKPGRRLGEGTRIEFGAGGLHAAEGAEIVLRAEILARSSARGGRLVRFEPQGSRSLDEAIHAVGSIPLPPYITEYEGDPEMYQTVYAHDEERSAAAPTAGLHFTPELLVALQDKGVELARLELEVGVDTFRVVTEENPEDHEMHKERYTVSQDVVDQIKACKQRGGRVIAVGTTSVRSLESACREDEGRTDTGILRARDHEHTQLFLRPGSNFHIVDAMITNFHVPRSTLMMLVSAFASHELIMHAYEQAIHEQYRFLSFGDAMLIL